MADDDRPASYFNKQPILNVLQKYVDPAKGHWLELASGLGEHAAHFAVAFPQLQFQPSDVSPSGFGVITDATKHLPNVRPPVLIDCAAPFSSWHAVGVEEGTYDYACCINMVHIAPWACSLGLFAGVSQALKPKGLLFTYGPYNIGGRFTHESNEAFDRSLRSRNPLWGVRDVEALEAAALPHGIVLHERVPMPHDNFTLVWRKN